MNKCLPPVSMIWIILIGVLSLSGCLNQAATSNGMSLDSKSDTSSASVADPPITPSGPTAQVDEDTQMNASVGKDDAVEDVGSSAQATAPALTAGEWMELPVIPEVSASALEIYAEGIRKGNDPHAFSKVGDCQNVPSMFVSIFDYPGFYTLGEEYEYLSETIEWYQGSFKHESHAVRRGFNAASVVSPVWADPEFCDVGEDPLQCEIRIHNPSVAIISLETWWAGNPENYEKYVRQIIETLISDGVLPILATKADNLEGDHRINGILARLANEYQIPLWNFWLAVQALPDHGLMEDGFHLTFAPNDFDDPQVMKAAWPWRNLTALQVLYAVREAIQNAN
jgi:hypothetical protein